MIIVNISNERIIRSERGMYFRKSFDILYVVCYNCMMVMYFICYYYNARKVKSF